MAAKNVVNPVTPKPGTFRPIPPVRQPVTGPPAVQGYPDGTKGNKLGAKPVGKVSK